ncbi:hypothetical protein ACN42_g11690, partial [Penicillium freii]
GCVFYYSDTIINNTG